MNKIIIFYENNILYVCEVNNSKAVRIFICTNEDVPVNSIVVGRIDRVKRDLNAYFVKISKDTNLFLSGKDLNPMFLLNREYDGRFIEGDEIAVQIINEPIKTKLPSASMNLTIPGKLSVITSEAGVVHISGKLNKCDTKDLVSEAENIISDYPHCGLIVRTNALKDSVSFALEARKSCEQMEGLIKSVKTRSLYSVLYKPVNEYITRIMDIPISEYDEIITDSPEIFEELKHYFDNSLLRFYNDDSVSLSVLYSFNRMLKDATSKKVDLKSGGYIIIEPTEALTVIDVNTGKNDRFKDKNRLITVTNREAAEEISRQLILRNISGIIVVDFINISNAEDEEELKAYLKGLLRKDSTKCEFIDFTPLGLSEITRKKTYKSIYDCLKKDII